jgi:hypothetical protein
MWVLEGGEEKLSDKIGSDRVWVKPEYLSIWPVASHLKYATLYSLEIRPFLYELCNVLSAVEVARVLMLLIYEVERTFQISVFIFRSLCDPFVMVSCASLFRIPQVLCP